MADLVGRQASITFSSITTPANGHIVDADFAKILHDSTRFGDVAVRRTPGLADGQYRVACWIDSAATPSLTNINAGTAAVLTIQLDGSASHQYVVTNCFLERMHYRAQANSGSPVQMIIYDIAQTAVSAGTQPAIAT